MDGAHHYIFDLAGAEFGAGAIERCSTTELGMRGDQKALSCLGVVPQQFAQGDNTSEVLIRFGHVGRRL